MYNYICSACGHAFNRPDKARDDFPCPKCGKRMDERLVENNSSTQVVWLFLFGILAALGFWYLAGYFTEKPNNPQQVPEQQKPAK
jgi:DNA-directed RNA polymerase subunit RPC12/RpoP